MKRVRKCDVKTVLDLLENSLAYGQSKLDSTTIGIDDYHYVHGRCTAFSECILIIKAYLL